MATKRFKTNSQVSETSEENVEDILKEVEENSEASAISSEENTEETLEEVEETSKDFDDVLEDIKEISTELKEVIEEYIEESANYISTHEQNLIDLNIPYCKKCKLQFTVDLYGNPQCEKQLKDCPTII